MVPVFTQIPISKGGTQLYPGGPGGYATDHSPPAAVRPWKERAADASNPTVSACTTRRSDIRQVSDRLHVTRLLTLVSYVCLLALLTTRRAIWQC